MISVLRTETIDISAVQRVLHTLKNTPFGSCNSIPHAKKIGDDIRKQLVQIDVGNQSELLGSFHHHFCEVTPYSCAHRINGRDAGFGPEIEALESAGVKVPKNIRKKNTAYQTAMNTRDKLAHRITGVAQIVSDIPEHTQVTEEAYNLGMDLHQSLIALCREACN